MTSVVERDMFSLYAVKERIMSLKKNSGILQKNPYIVVFFLVIMAVIAFPLFKIFAVPVVMAAALATLFYPIYKIFNERLIKNKFLSSLLCCVLLLLCVLLPLYCVGFTVSKQVAGLYTSSGPTIKAIVVNGEKGMPKGVAESRIYRWIKANNIDVAGILQDAVKTAVNVTSGLINKASASVVLFAGNIFIILFTMFYFFIDGETLLNKLRRLSPLKKTYTELLFHRFSSISRATVKGVLAISFLQATVGGIILLVFGVKNWLMWALIMAMLGLVPPLGAWMILIPTGIIQIVMGNVWPGIGIMLLSICVVTPIDNILRPRIVGSSAKMHDLLIFFSTLGGIIVFGVMGIVVGPVIAALFVAAINIYEMDQSHQKSMEANGKISLKSNGRTSKSLMDGRD